MGFIFLNMKVHFITPTKLSILDITSMGDSSKRGDDSKIGAFDSGLKYAIALLLRDDVGIEISVFDQGGEENNFTFKTITVFDESTSKNKELIAVKKLNGEETITGFAKNLGYNWEVWMAYREIMSNVLDENGYVLEDEDGEELDNGTVVTLEFDEDNEFYNVWQNRHLYMNFEEPLFKVSDSVEALKNDEGYLRIYKQNILVYENKERPSRFAWNIKFGEIDERRILSNIYSIEQSIASTIQTTNNENFLRVIITNDFKTQEKEFLIDNTYYSNWVSDTVKKVVHEVYNEYGDVKSYEWLIDKVKKQKDCKIAGKKINTVEDSLWAYSTEVTVETEPKVIYDVKLPVEGFIEETFADKIKKHYNFNLDVEVKIAKLKGSKVVADKYEKCLIIDESFNIEYDFHIFIVEYVDLKYTENVVTSLSKYICNLISK